MSLWTCIAEGKTRLTPGEDRTLWRMRGEGRDWPEIEEAIIARRAHHDEQGERNRRRLLRADVARRYRDRLRVRRLSGERRMA